MNGNIKQPLTEEQLDKVYGHILRRTIVQLLNMYKELSLTQLSKMLKQNKTTIQYHITELKKIDVIKVSRISHEESRGAIPKKYYKLNFANLDRHFYLTKLEPDVDPKTRLDEYEQFLLCQRNSIIYHQSLLGYAKDSIENSLKIVSDLQNNPDILTKARIAELDDYIKQNCISITGFSTAKQPFLEMSGLVSEFYDKVVKTEKEFYQKEKSELTDLGKTEEEIKVIFQTNEKYSESHQVLTYMFPLKNLIKSSLDLNFPSKKNS
ncbi:MAG: winged helix-turn-helix domain-containing protein [Candidatus Hodarchaeales archaeon]|jgi:DNA-binding transcriptional ArsR family regulator